MDVLCVGGASILVLLPLLLTRETGILGNDRVLYPWLDSVWAWLALLINVPHFMASYRMVYRSRETVLKYRWAALYVPAILLVYSLFAVGMAGQGQTLWISTLAAVSGAYLAWHYTGQTWGMMATYAHLHRAPFDRTEMRLIRGGLRILLAWHVAWYFYWSPNTPEARDLWGLFYTVLAYGTILSIGLGAWGLVRCWKRTDRIPSLRTLVPWVAIFVWYSAMATDPAAIFWVQIAHALQYLSFPMRVEANRAAREPGVSRREIGMRVFFFAAALLLLSFVFLEFAEPLAGAAAATLFGSGAAVAAAMVPNLILNIHHYFTDGAVWKMRDPQVRADLFGHLDPGERRNHERQRARARDTAPTGDPRSNPRPR